MRSYYSAGLVFSCSLFLCVFSVNAQSIPTGTAVTPNALLDLFRSIGGFLLVAGGILASLVIMVTGIMYMLAGSNTQQVTTAKNMFKAGIIGALIIFSTGTIIGLITGFASSPLGFFGGGGGGGVTTYNCVDGACQQAVGGTYSTQSDCESQC